MITLREIRFTIPANQWCSITCGWLKVHNSSQSMNSYHTWLTCSRTLLEGVGMETSPVRSPTQPDCTGALHMGHMFLWCNHSKRHLWNFKAVSSVRVWNLIRTLCCSTWTKPVLGSEFLVSKNLNPKWAKTRSVYQFFLMQNGDTCSGNLGNSGQWVIPNRCLKYEFNIPITVHSLYYASI